MKKLLSILLAISFLLGLSVPVFAQDTEIKNGADYTTVFVHGFFGWGDEDGFSYLLPMWGGLNGDMTQYLQRLGYDTFEATVGPISSAHDRCCEIFAQLTGSKVDYGQAHADKRTAEYTSLGYSLVHGRYGRDYTGHPGIKSWGPIYDENGKVTGWYDNKINLVGHSFGGPTVLEFLELLAKGDADEQAWGKAQAAQFGGDWHDYISPLFWGDYQGEFLINSITSVAGALNGTTLVAANEEFIDFLGSALLLAANTTGLTDLGAFYDFQLEQFGLTRIPGSDMNAKFSYLNQKGFLAGSDHAFHDVRVDAINEFKKSWNTYDNVYYFSHSCDSSHEWAGGRFSCPIYIPDSILRSFLLPVSIRLGAYTNPSDEVLTIDGSVYGTVDETWLPNDGLVNTVSEHYPFGAPHADYGSMEIQPGIWFVYPDLSEQHLEPLGVTTFAPIRTRQFFETIMKDIEKT